MSRMFPIPALVAAVSLTAACAPAPKAPDRDAMIAAARALDDQFLAAFNRGDADAIAALYADDPNTMSFPPDAMMHHGMPAIRAGAVKMLADMKGAQLELFSVHHMPLADAVVSSGLWKLTMTGPDGKPMVTEGRFTDVKAERNGKWVYLIDHASVPMPPPPPPAVKK